MPHPFHIHINPFQVVEIDIPSLVQSPRTSGPDNPVTYSHYLPKDNFVWQDVIAIPSAATDKDGNMIYPIYPGKITIRQTYPDFTGTYVLHCHILAHEYRGMMELVRVVAGLSTEVYRLCSGTSLTCLGGHPRVTSLDRPPDSEGKPNLSKRIEVVTPVPAEGPRTNFGRSSTSMFGMDGNFDSRKRRHLFAVVAGGGLGRARDARHASNTDD